MIKNSATSEAAALFRELLDAANALIFVNDASTGEIVYANQTACDKLGYTESELLGTYVHELEVSFSDHTEWESHVDRIKKHGQLRFDGKQQRKDGTVFPVEVNLGVVTLDSEYVIAIARDISDQRERERKLECIHERFQFALDATDSFFWVLDIESGERTMQMGPIHRLFDVSPEYLSSMDEFLKRGVHPDDRVVIGQEIEQILHDEKTEFEVQYRTNQTADGGSRRWIHSIGYVTSNDERRQLVGLGIDITEQKRRQQELTRQNERLNEFASIVSHDLRNPLNVAQARLELAREACDSDHFEAIDRAHERMEALIDDLLFLARAGESSTEVTPIDVETLVKDCWQTVQTNQATLVTDIDQLIHADESRLRRLFENLIRNAIEHGGEGVTITVGERDDGFYIEDDGPGIPPEKREVIFDVGYSTNDRGTGYGLAIVRQVVEAHGWQISATEGTAGGARFEISGVEFAT